MTRKLTLVGLLGCAIAAQAPAQETDPSAQPAPIAAQPTAQTSQPATTSAPTQQRIPASELTIDQLLLVARRAGSTGRTREAFQALEVILQRDPANPDALRAIADLSFMQQDLNTARSYYKKVLEIQPSDFPANLGLGRTYLRAEIWRQSMRFLEIAETLAPRNQLADVLALLATAYQRGGDATKALQTAQRALQLDPQNIATHRVLVPLWIAVGQHNRAMHNATATVELIKVQLAKQPPTAAGLNELQQAYASQYGVLEAYMVTLGERTATGQPTGQLRAGRVREAATALKQMADLRVIQAQVAHTLQYFDVLAHLAQAVQLVPDDPQYWLEYGLVLLQVSHPEKAAQAFKKVVELDPDNAEARRQLDRLTATPTSSPAARDTP